MFFTPDDIEMMRDSLQFSGASSFQLFDIRRRIQEGDTRVGGFTVTSTAIESRRIDLQNLRGEDIISEGGLRIEANFHGFIHKESDIADGDTITPDSGTTKYQIKFVQKLWNDHIEFFAKKVT